MAALLAYSTNTGLRREVIRLASMQHGLVTRSQALGIGLSSSALRNELATGRWERLHRGVYRVAGQPETWKQQLMAAILFAGNGACASHRAAGALWSLEGIGCKLVEISVPAKVRFADPAVIAHRTYLPRADVVLLEPIPVTEPSRTLLDLAAVLTLEDAWRRGLVTLARLRWRLAGSRSKGKRGATELRKLLDDRPRGTAPSGSALEVRFKQLLKSSGFHLPVGQYEIKDKGILIARVDFAYPDSKLAIEVDGYKWHSGRRAWDRDLARGNALAASGWRCARVSARDLESPERLIATIRQFLGN